MPAPMIAVASISIHAVAIEFSPSKLWVGGSIPSGQAKEII